MAKENIPKKSESIRARMHRFINSKKELSVAEFERSINLSNGFVNGIGDSIRRISLEKIKVIIFLFNPNISLIFELSKNQNHNDNAKRTFKIQQLSSINAILF